VISQQAGLIHYAEGRVLLNSSALAMQPGRFRQMRQEDMLSTRAGRAEVLLNPGSFLRLGEETTVRLASGSLIEPSFEAVAGSVVLEMNESSKDVSLNAIWKGVIVKPEKRGVYRLDADAGRLSVFEGKALVRGGGKVIEVKEGRTLAFGGAWVPVKFNVKQTDALDRWSGRRAVALARANEAVVMQNGFLGSASSCMTSMWMFNSAYGVLTYVPCGASYMNFYGVRYYELGSRELYMANNPAPAAFDSGASRRQMDSTNYSTNSPTSVGTSGTVAAGSTVSTSQDAAPTAPVTRSTGDASSRAR
jgi:hypothetical protein